MHDRAAGVGKGNVFEAKSSTGAGVTVGDFCRVGAGVTLAAEERLPDGCVVYGGGASAGRRIDGVRLRAGGDGDTTVMSEQMELLRASLPKFHPMQSST